MSGRNGSTNGHMRGHAAVMFADMRGFTAMAERLQPNQVFDLLNEFFSVLTDVAMRHQGTVFNMAGDSLMVGFGIPEPYADSGIRALRAAREMLMNFEEIALHWHERLGVEVGLGIGINEGDVVAGDLGANGYLSHTLIGDTVNIAARLSQRARAGEVLFSNSLRLSLDATAAEEVHALPLPPLVLRGRTNPIDIYCVPTEKRIDVPH